MSIIKLKQPPLAVSEDDKRDVRTQFGALCYRIKDGEVQVLLITSRTSRRWIIPKGWPMADERPADAALQEAYEEAGVEGKAFNVCIGLFSYTKAMRGSDDLPCVVSIFPVRVKRLLKDYPEVKERRRRWFTPKQAAAQVREPELRKILKNFDPKLFQG